MTRLSFYIATFLALSFFLQGCAGIRNSYESLLDTDSDKPLIVLEAGEKREVLAVGDGFPGWWGYFPGIISTNPEVASVTCEKGRSLIPFREPGVVFGGRRCYIETHKIGLAWLGAGNLATLRNLSEDSDYSMASEDIDSRAKEAGKWIKVKVVSTTAR